MIPSARTCVLVLLALCACNHEGSVGVVCTKADCDSASPARDDSNGRLDAGSKPTGDSGGAAVTTDGTGGMGSTMAITSGRPQSCRVRPLSLTRRELAVHFSIDLSMGMSFWWPPLLDGFKHFVADPESDGLNVGLSYFSDACEVEKYVTPAVGMGALPVHRAQLLGGFPQKPTSYFSAALSGLIGAHDYARKWSVDHPEHHVVVLFVTNTLDNDCQTSLPEMTRIAKERLNDPVSIPTWVLALNTYDLDPIAQAGGSGKALVAENLAADSVAQRLNELRDAAQPLHDEHSCRLALPAESSTAPGQSDEQIDLRRSRLRFEMRDGSEQTLSPVAEPAACDAAGGGFYQPADSKATFVVCASSCSTLRDVRAVEFLSECPDPGA